MIHFSRRHFLALAATSAARASYLVPTADDIFLEDLSRRAFLFFWEQADTKTGLILDRARNSGTKSEGHSHEVASMASTGFGLCALCIAYKRGWAKPEELLGRIRITLRHIANNQANVNGWYYHFIDMRSGERVWKCELSTIDTAFLLAGVLTVQRCFPQEAEISRLAREIYERVDFLWMLDTNSGLLRMGWKPESGFLRAWWLDYRENAILHILGIASPTHPIPVDTWYRFQRDPVVFQDYRFIGGGSLFTHQYPQAWLDLRGLHDGSPFHLDYFNNSIVATYAHRAYCLSLRSLYPTYSENAWGITPSDSEIGYLIWGNPYSRRDIDGTVVPCGPGGSLMFTPEISIAALRAMYEQHGDYIYGRYGFVDAFHPAKLWVDTDVVGIDQGIVLLSAENLRSGRIWKWFMSHPDIQRATNRIFS